jgi:hypothetical protein
MYMRHIISEYAILDILRRNSWYNNLFAALQLIQRKPIRPGFDDCSSDQAVFGGFSLWTPQAQPPLTKAGHSGFRPFLSRYA